VRSEVGSARGFLDAVESASADAAPGSANQRSTTLSQEVRRDAVQG